jgi:hypothetical protein
LSATCAMKHTSLSVLGGYVRYAALRLLAVRENRSMAKQRMPQSTVTAVHARSQGKCERCGTSDSLRWSLHHRKPRGMGGSRDPLINSPANILLLCGSGTEGCHGWVESNRNESYASGLLVHRNDDPAEFPVTLRYGEVYLDDVGGVQTC